MSIEHAIWKVDTRPEWTGVGNTSITLSKLCEVIIPLPPLANKHRIVAKVDGLMALCDTLNTRIKAAQNTHTTSPTPSACKPSAV